MERIAGIRMKCVIEKCKVLVKNKKRRETIKSLEFTNNEANRTLEGKATKGY